MGGWMEGEMHMPDYGLKGSYMTIQIQEILTMS